MSLIYIILAIIIPPIAVATRTGISGQLFLSIVLTLIGWIPGVIHALWIGSKS